MTKLITIQLIMVDEKLAGDGNEDPFRRIVQYFTPDGTLVLEYDHHLDKTYASPNLVNYLKDLLSK